MKLYCSPCGDLGGSAAVYALLEAVFRLEYGGDFPVIKKTANGKPYFQERRDIHFSLSHARTHVLCGLSTSPIGVDIESPRCISLRARSFFSKPEELRIFDPLDLWVLKESYVKLIGATLPMIKKLQFYRDGERIIPPDPNASSRLYRICGCRAAVSTFGEAMPDDIELISVPPSECLYPA